MAKKKVLESALGDLGLAGGFLSLIEKAVREKWTVNEFLQALQSTPRFKRLYPGLLTGDGRIQQFLVASGATDLVSAVRLYNQLFATYRDVAGSVDPSFGLGRKFVGQLIRGMVSPDEFATRLAINKRLAEDPDLLASFNQILSLRGKQSLDELGQRKFLARSAEKNLYDIYEAAQLAISGLEITAKEANKLAGEIDLGPGQGPVDISSLIADLFQLKPDIAPELTAAGISDVDLVRAASGTDPEGKVQRFVTQFQQQRRALGTFVSGTQPRRSPAGGLSLFPEEEEGLD